MVKSLADELTLILNWIENPGRGQNAVEEAKNGLVCFCRGLVVGLRASEPIEIRGDIPIDTSFAKDWSEAERRRSREANANASELRPVDEALKDPGAPLAQRGLI